MNRKPENKTKKLILAAIITLLIISVVASGILISLLASKSGFGNESSTESEETSSPDEYTDTSAIAGEESHRDVSEVSEAVSYTDISESTKVEVSEEEDMDSTAGDADPKLLVDSTVMLVGDTMTVRFFDGKNTYAISDDLTYYSQPNTVLISEDNSHYRNYIVATSPGRTTVIGEMNGLELTKDIYVHRQDEATNNIICDTSEIVFGVTKSGAGAVNITLNVEGWDEDNLEARFYTNAGPSFKGDLWITAEGEWNNSTLKATITNYLSSETEGELVVVVTKKNEPESLVGVCRIPIRYLR